MEKELINPATVIIGMVAFSLSFYLIINYLNKKEKKKEKENQKEKNLNIAFIFLFAKPPVDNDGLTLENGGETLITIAVAAVCVIIGTIFIYCNKRKEYDSQHEKNFGGEFRVIKRK